jgi:quercetin dioxygenase-like cupin family protein
VAATLIHQRWVDIPSEPVAAGIERRYLTGDRVTVAQFELKLGGIVPRHSHESEQITQVLRGVLKFAIDGREIIVREGDVLQIPSWMEHEVEVLEDAFVIDVFSPVRQDWIDRADDYFRR